MEPPIIDPPTPYLGPIQGGFISGKMVRIQGYVPPVGERIDINFQTSEKTSPRDDIGLHVSLRIAEGYVARNSCQGNIWGEEQGDGVLPIQPGQRFEIIVFADNSLYKIAINGCHFCEFPQKLPSSQVTHLSIEGDVSLSLISYEGGNVSQGLSATASQNVGPPQGNFGPPQGNFGPPQGNFGPPQGNFGPPQGNFGPPQGNFGPPPQGYGPPPGQFPAGAYGAPPPPPGPEENKDGLSSFFDSAGTIIAGAISSGVAEKLLSSISSGGASNQQQPQAQPPPPPPPPPQAAGGGADILGGLGSLISSFAAPQSNQYAPPPQQQQPYYGTGAQAAPAQDPLSGIGSFLSSLTHSQTQAPPAQQPSPLDPSQIGGQGSVGGLGSVGSLLSTLAGQVLTPQNKGQGH